MKKRTIEEIHDREIGCSKFAKALDRLINSGYTITDIEEYNEKFKFKVDGHHMEYPKCWSSTIDAFVKWTIKTVEEDKIFQDWANHLANQFKD